MSREAQTSSPVHELIAKRWSPYGFDGRSVSEADLCSLFEAARWAASSYNEQPWSFIVARRDDEEAFAKAVGCLVEFNQQWAKEAGALLIGCTSTQFERNGKPNGKAEHDLGLAVGNLSLEATSRGLCVHQMGGIMPDVARETYSIPEHVKPVTGIAIGYSKPADQLESSLRERDEAPRERKSLGDMVFSGSWGTASGIVS